jgi:hypothetical protein
MTAFYLDSEWVGSQIFAGLLLILFQAFSKIGWKFEVDEEDTWTLDDIVWTRTS